MKTADDPRYQLYLLRLWRNRSDAPWRITLQGADDQRPFQFQSMAQFIEFLEALQPPELPTQNEETK